MNIQNENLILNEKMLALATVVLNLRLAGLNLLSSFVFLLNVC